MGDAVLGLIFALLILLALNVIDINISVEKHVAGEKTICIRGKEVKDGK